MPLDKEAKLMEKYLFNPVATMAHFSVLDGNENVTYSEGGFGMHSYSVKW